MCGGYVPVHVRGGYVSVPGGYVPVCGLLCGTVCVCEDLCVVRRKSALHWERESFRTVAHLYNILQYQTFFDESRLAQAGEDQRGASRDYARYVAPRIRTVQ